MASSPEKTRTLKKPEMVIEFESDSASSDLNKIRERKIRKKEEDSRYRDPQSESNEPLSINDDIYKILWADFMSSISVGFVNLPMCMAFSSAAKLDPAVGITSAFWSSLYIVISDSKYCITSAAMSVALLTGSLRQQYTPEEVSYLLMFTSLIILVTLYTRLYKFLVIIPKGVMDGFLAGCVIGIFCDQLGKIFSLKVNNDTGTLINRMWAGIIQVIAKQSEINWFGVWVYFIMVSSLFLLMKFWPTRPWVLLMCLVSIGLGLIESSLLPEDFNLKKLSEEYPTMKLNFLTVPTFSTRTIYKLLSSFEFYINSFSMALIILLESLVTWGMISISSDQMYLSKTKNMFVLVLGNLLTILTGTMGIAFVYARSMLNLQAGARSKMACIFNGLICLGIGIILFKLFSFMPSVALEAILMGLELKTIRIGEFIFNFKKDFKLFLAAISVLISMLFLSASVSIFVGLFVYLAFFAKEFLTPKSELAKAKFSQISEEFALAESGNLNLTSS